MRNETIIKMLSQYNDFVILVDLNGDIMATEGSIPEDVTSRLDDLLSKYAAETADYSQDEGFEHCTVEVIKPRFYEQIDCWILLGRYRRFDQYPLTENLPIGVIVLDKNLMAIYCNAIVQVLLGLANDEILGRGWLHAFNEDFITELKDYVDSSEGFTEPFKKPIEITTPLGKKYILSFQFSLRKDINTNKYQYYIVIQDITKEYAALEKIHYLAHHDRLTGLANREVLMQHIRLQLENNNFNNCLLVYLDINKFKQINDTYGHNTGDEVLKITAKRLVNSVKSRDIVARVGGDEFVVLMKDTASDVNLDTIGKKLISRLTQKFRAGDENIDLRVSVGITSGSTYAETLESLGEDDQSEEVKIDEWVRSADIVMYEAKKMEEGGYVIFDNSYHKLQIEEKHQFNLLKDEIENELGYRLFQPIIKDGKVYSVETLSRFLFEKNIEKIIELAFRNHYAKSLFDYLLYACLADFKKLLDKLMETNRCFENLKVNVNIDILQLEDEGFALKLKAYVESLSLLPEFIYLEITEKVLESNQAVVNEQLELLKALGFRLSIDDFGTGYNSIQRLIRYEFDQIKLDRSFFSGVEEQVKLQAALKAASQIGKSLDMEVLGEGVENKQELEFAVKNDIQIIQGYLYSKPLNERDFINFAHKAVSVGINYLDNR